MSDSLEFRLLKYIVAVAETSNFTRAAERLFLAQPSLSKQIRDLEEEIRFPIFDRSREGVRITLAGEMVLAYAKETLRAREELLEMARAVHLGEVPPLRLGFSSFVNDKLLQSFRETYCEMFPGCEIQLAGGEPMQILQRINRRSLDCAILPMPIDNDLYHVQQGAQSPLVICLRADDPLALQTQLDIQGIALRIKIFRDPELQPSAHSRLVEMFEEVSNNFLKNSAKSSSSANTKSFPIGRLQRCSIARQARSCRAWREPAPDSESCFRMARSLRG